MRIFQKLFKHLTVPLILGVIIGFCFNYIGALAFFTYFATHSIFYLLLLVGTLALLFLGVWFSWAETDEIWKPKSINLRMYLLGISLASLAMFIVNIATNLHEANFGGGVIEIYGGFPFVTIMGIPFHSIVWSLFSAIMFSTIERILKVWEDSWVGKDKKVGS
jgi:hypothetical protein